MSSPTRDRSLSAILTGNIDVDWKALLDAYLYVYRHLTVNLTYKPYFELQLRGKEERINSYALFPSIVSDSWNSKTLADNAFVCQEMPLSSGSFEDLFSAYVDVDFTQGGEFRQVLFEVSYTGETILPGADVQASGTWFSADLTVDPESQSVLTSYVTNGPMPLSTVMRLYGRMFPERASFTLSNGKP